MNQRINVKREPVHELRDDIVESSGVRAMFVVKAIEGCEGLAVVWEAASTQRELGVTITRTLRAVRSEVTTAGICAAIASRTLVDKCS